jgi:hypothetical protein
MPGRIWLLAVVALLLAGSATAQAAPRRHAGHAAQAPRPAARPDIPPAVQREIDRIATALESVNAKLYSKVDDDRVQRGLEAQETVARWTAVTAAIAALNMLIIALGVAAVVLALRHARRTATAAGGALREIRENGQKELRAYLQAIRAQIAAGGGDVEIRFGNFGRTPAHNVSVWVNAVIQNDDLAAPALEKGEAAEIVQGTVAPSLDFVSGAKFVGSQPASDRPATTRNSACAYAFGLITYTDIFNRQHKTEFCFLAPWPSAGDMAVCEAHTGAD